MLFHKKSVGIIGGGQLARMLALKANQMGLIVHVLTEKKTDPAAAIANFWHKGKTNSAKDLASFIKDVDIVTFESEFTPSYLLRKISKRLPTKKFYPSLKCLANFQDRLLQKEWLYDYDIPTLDYVKISGKDDLDLAFQTFNHHMVLKKRIGGYDGYGTHVICTTQELNNFKKNYRGEESSFIAERYVKFQSEKSLIFARNSKKEIIHYPLVDSVQKNHQCDYVIGPTTHPEERNMAAKISGFLQAIDYVGVIAFELFEVRGHLFVNEVAPRVHNTGHFTQDACSIDQFEMHLRCVLNYSLSDIYLHAPQFVMVNLLGQTQRIPHIEKMPTGALHWYEKTENRPRRKMGHINYVGKQKSALLKKALNERKGIVL